MKETSKKQNVKRVVFKSNEPTKQLPGGLFRESTIIDSELLPDKVRRRRELNAILANHCSSVDIRPQLMPGDETILMRMARETIVTGCHPVIRKKAIWALGTIQSAASINLLSELVENGEDEYIRAASINSIAEMKIRFAIPALLKGLTDKADLIRNASAQALYKIRMAAGPHELIPYLKDIKDKEGVTVLKRLIDDRFKKKIKKGNVVKSD
jgi:hypothetical protein